MGHDSFHFCLIFYCYVSPTYAPRITEDCLNTKLLYSTKIEESVSKYKSIPIWKCTYHRAFQIPKFNYYIMNEILNNFR